MRRAGIISILLCIASIVVSQVTPFTEGAGWTQYGPLDYTAFGWSMTTAGDVNGDGYEDMIVSAIDYSNPIATEEEEGRLFLYYGGPDGLSTDYAWTYESNQTVTVLGFSTSGGDVNGDGYSDVVAGGLQWTGDQADEGKIFLWYGSAAGLNPGEPDWTLEFDQAGALLGSGVAMDGDFNGDGFNDLFVSAKMWDEPEIEEGKIWLYWGSVDGPVYSGWSWQPDQAGAIAGFPLNYAGDLNGDGYVDLVTGANQYDYDVMDDGLAVAFYGGPGLPNTSPDWMASSGQKKCNFGHWVDGAGDVNGDGYDDVVVSALLYESDTSEGNEGRVFVFHGSADGPSTSPDWFGEVNQEQAQLGYSCAGAGDINNDGYDDVIGGAKYWDDGNQDEGGAFVWFGGPSGLEINYCWDASGDQDSAYYGRHVGGNCDFNGDGYSDYMVGAYRYTEILEADGKGFVYYGAPRPSDFHFTSAHYCISDVNPTPIIDGLTGGIFESATAVVDSITGEINLIASGAGVFAITYTATGDCSVTHIITIEDPALTEWVHYPFDSICVSYGIIVPEITAGAMLHFTSATLEINDTTGAFDPVTAPIGEHWIVWTGNTDAGCAFTDSVSITILPDLVISLTEDSICADAGTLFSTVNIAGGIFSSDGIAIDSITGTFDASTATEGLNTIYYAINVGCAIAGTELFVHYPDNSLAAFAYGDDSICNFDMGYYPIDVVTDGGVFTGSIVLDSLTGVIVPALVTPGVYTIVHTVADGVCMAADTFTITVLEDVDPYFEYAENIYFQDDAIVTPEVITSGSWFAIPDGLVLDTLTGSFDPAASDTGTYYVYHIVENEYCANELIDTIYIYPSCTAPTDLVISDLTPTSCLLTWTLVPGYTEYLVRVDDGAFITDYSVSGNTFFISILEEESTYTFSVIVLCTEYISAESEPLIVETPVDVQDIRPEISVSPNPANNLLNIYLTPHNHNKVALYDMQGVLLQEMHVNGNYQLDISNLASGIYYLQYEGSSLMWVKL